MMVNTAMSRENAEQENTNTDCNVLALIWTFLLLWFNIV